MAAEYYLYVKDAAGNPVAHIDDYQELTYSKRLWEPGLLSFTLDGSNSKIPLLTDNAQIEVWRRNKALGIDWYCDFYGLYRSKDFSTPQDQTYFTGKAPGQMTMLSWAYIMWPDKIANRSIFTAVPAETIIKTLAKYNVTTANATTGNGRAVSWPISGISVETDQGRGNTLDWKCAWKPLLGELQAIAKIAGGDFDYVKTGPTSWEVRYYPGQLGTDRTASVVFALEYSNMKKPKYSLDKINEATIAVVGGRGQGAGRDYQVVTGKTYNATTNYIETFVHAAEQDTDAYMTAKGQEALYKAQARNQLQFQILQTPACLYGRDYFLGDLVKARYQGIDFTQKVFGVVVNFKQQSSTNPEVIDVEMRDV